MPRSATSTFKMSVADEVAVTVKIDGPARPAPDVPFFILAHGANNDLDFPLLAYLAVHLAEAGLASTVRFNFPYVERGVTSPDPRPILESTFARVYGHVVQELAAPGAPVFVGGKSLGGRTAAELVSRRAAGEGLAAAGLIVLGYPLHAMGREDHLWIDPLRHIDIPSLFFVGTRDSLCNPELLRPVLAGLVRPGTLFVVEGGDHSLHLSRASGRHPQDSYPAVAERVADFITRTTARAGPFGLSPGR
jgi:predicted alpha/beta-hydrolase family hydrolase